MSAALDEESERQVRAAIDEVMKEATVIMIAHRLNTLRKVDRIYRVENGKITPCDPGELFKKEKNDFSTTGK